jgi:acetyl esterase/lipase
MKYDVVNLNEHYNVQGGTLKSICIEKPWDSNHDNWNRPALLIIPGGAYRFVSNRESESIAADFLAKGYQTFILTYLVKDDGARYPEQLKEIACAVDYIKKHSAEYGVDVNRVFAVGFSAGGHLASTMLVTENDSIRPNFGILFYPVISMKKELTHLDSHNQLLGRDASQQLEDQFSNELHVSEKTPPTFIAVASDDKCVSPQNSILFNEAMVAKKRSVALYVYPSGGHGFVCRLRSEYRGQALDDLYDWLSNRRQE